MKSKKFNDNLSVIPFLQAAANNTSSPIKIAAPAAAWNGYSAITDCGRINGRTASAAAGGNSLRKSSWNRIAPEMANNVPNVSGSPRTS